jgi:hypothetical protein
LEYDSIPNYDLIVTMIRDIGGADFKGDFYPGVVAYDWQVPIGDVPAKVEVVDEIAAAEGAVAIGGEHITPNQEERVVRRKSSRGIFTPFMNAVGRAAAGARSGGVRRDTFMLEPTPPTSEPRMHLRSRRYLRNS